MPRIIRRGGKQAARALTVVLTGTAVALTGLSGPASAAPPERGTSENSIDVVEPDFCGSPGLTVHIEGTRVRRFLEMSRGQDGLPYYMDHMRFEGVLTNVSTGEYVRNVELTTGKDLKVTDNGDGTYTVLVLVTGNARLYDSDGKLIAADPGQVRFKVRWDNAGTPSDTSDDTPLGSELVKGSTGRNDDFCTALIAAIG